MLHLVSDNTTNIVPFPSGRTRRPTIEMVAVLSPPQSLVDSLLTERGLVPDDAHAVTEKEIGGQAHMLHAAHGRDEVINRLRVLADTHVAQAVDLCQEYREADDSLKAVELEAAHAGRPEPHLQMKLVDAREALSVRAIAARNAANAAFGASTAFSHYVLDGLAGLPISKADTRQLSLFAVARSGVRGDGDQRRWRK